MPRAMNDPRYVYEPLSSEHRAAISSAQRKRHGAPDGHCTVRGIHVPAEHGPALHYWAKWITDNHGADEGQRFVLTLKDRGWTGVDALKELWAQRREISRNQALIRALEREVRHAH